MWLRLRKRLAFCSFLFVFNYSLAAADLSGSVVSVLDGDTIEVLHNSHPESIRVSGIDCPEKGEAYGQKAKQAASALVFGKNVTDVTQGHDTYKRTIREVFLPDGTNVNTHWLKQATTRGTNHGIHVAVPYFSSHSLRVGAVDRGLGFHHHPEGEEGGGEGKFERSG